MLTWMYMIVTKWKFTDLEKKKKQNQDNFETRDTENREVWMLTMEMETLTFKFSVWIQLALMIT